VILIDRNGKVVFAAEGPLQDEEQDRLLELLRIELQA